MLLSDFHQTDVLCIRTVPLPFFKNLTFSSSKRSWSISSCSRSASSRNNSACSSIMLFLEDAGETTEAGVATSVILLDATPTSTATGLTFSAETTTSLSAGLGVLFDGALGTFLSPAAKRSMLLLELFGFVLSIELLSSPDIHLLSNDIKVNERSSTVLKNDPTVDSTSLHLDDPFSFNLWGPNDTLKLPTLSKFADKRRRTTVKLIEPLKWGTIITKPVLETSMRLCQQVSTDCNLYTNASNALAN